MPTNKDFSTRWTAMHTDTFAIISFKVAYSCIVLTILVVALILLCSVIPMCVLPFLDDNTVCCQDKHRSNMSSNILNKISAVAD